MAAPSAWAALLGPISPISRVSIESSQWRICCRSGAGTPSILEMISTGNGPAKPPTSSISSEGSSSSR